MSNRVNEDDTYQRVVDDQYQHLDSARMRMRESMRKYVDKAREEYEKIYGQQEQEEHRNYFKEDYLDRDSSSSQYFDKVVQTVPLRDLKEIVGSCYYDETLEFCAVLTQINDEKLKEKLEVNFQLEVWWSGILLYQRALNKKVRAWNVSRHNQSIIFLLDPEDEDHQGDIIHVVSLKHAFATIHESRVQNHDINDEDLGITEKKIRDWTGLCSQPQNMNFAIDKNNNLFVSTPEALHVLSLDDVEEDPRRRVINPDADIYELSDKARKGKLEFESDYRLLFMHDSESSYDKEENDTVFALFDSNGQVDYTRIESDMMVAEIKLELVQVAELNEEVVRNRRRIK